MKNYIDISMCFLLIIFVGQLNAQDYEVPDYYERVSENDWEPKYSIIELSSDKLNIYEFPHRYNVGIMLMSKARIFQEEDSLFYQVDTCLQYSGNTGWLWSAKINCDEKLSYKFISADSLMLMRSEDYMYKRDPVTKSKVPLPPKELLYVKTAFPTKDIDCLKHDDDWKEQATKRNKIVDCTK